MSILSQVAVLLLLALIVAVFLLMLRYGNSVQSRDSGGKGISKIWNGFHRGGRSGETMLLPMLFIDQLDPKTMESVEQFAVCDIPEKGVTISRPNAKSDGILLSKATKEAYTVSRNHAVIAMDDEGMFLQDCGSHNKMFTNGIRKPVEQVDITDGLIVYLGMQPLRFSIPCLQSMDSQAGDAGRGKPTMSQVYGKEPLSYSDAPVVRRRKR